MSADTKGFEDPTNYYEEGLPPVEHVDEEDLSDIEGLSLINRPLFLTPHSSEEDWRRHSIFLTTCHIGGFTAKMVIDPAASENVIAAKAVQKLKLPTKHHSRPYKLAWFSNSHIVLVSKRCLVSFSIGALKDEVWCDVAPLEACHLLLGLP